MKSPSPFVVITKLPLIRTAIISQTVIFCTAPGICFFWLSNPLLFNEMNISKLLLLTTSASSFFYMAILTLVAILTFLDEWLKEFIGKENLLDGSHRTHPINGILRKSIIGTNLILTTGIVWSVVNPLLKDNSFHLSDVNQGFTFSAIAGAFGWFYSIGENSIFVTSSILKKNTASNRV